MRASDGFVTGMHDVVPYTRTGYRVALFHPASNARQVSRLRLSNPGSEPAAVAIEGVDDTGASPGTAVRLTLAAGSSRTLTALDLETGEADGLSGALGGGTGRWRLTVHASEPLLVLNLLAGAATGRVSNLSSAPANVADGDDGATTIHTVPLLPSASREDLGGLVRVINRTDQAGIVAIEAFDDDGTTYGPVRLFVRALGARHFDAAGLEAGDIRNGLVGSTGSGTGDWRLRLSSTLELEVQSYVHAPGGEDGLLSSMHDVVPRNGAGHRVTVFDPDRVPGAGVDSGDAPGQVSRLRLINPHETATAVTITGMDGDGDATGTAVRLSLAPGASRTVTVPELETGEAEGLSGALGDGAGRWHLEVRSNRRIQVMHLLSGPGGDLANFSTAPGAPGAGPVTTGATAVTATAAELFGEHISEPIVQGHCVACHVEGGISGNTRLVFARDTVADHEAINLETFRSFTADVEEGADLILGKVQGVSHGGGRQLAAGSEDLASLERFLGRLDAGKESPTAITPETLFDMVRMAPVRTTLRRAALIFAGRLPTDAEYAAAYRGGAALRATIRGMMTGPAFHEFLIRGANDRLLTDRRDNIIDDVRFVDYTNEAYRIKKAAQQRDDLDDYYIWRDRVQHGAARAPLELIAHVVENDLPYTEILTADYIMANPWAAKAYGASTTFDDPEDINEFKPSRIETYYREHANFLVEHDDDVESPRVLNPGPLQTEYPHAGILNTTAFLLRYPSTATNRNRARARWTYYHFLGVDIEKSASRTTDPVALADTNNPTYWNPACTVCHTVMDPVAGAFQNYGDLGLYRDQDGGFDSLDGHYKEGEHNEPLPIRSGSWDDRGTLSWSVKLAGGPTTLRVVFTNPFHDDRTREQRHIYLDRISITGDTGQTIASHEFEDLPVPVADDGWLCGEVRDNPVTGRQDHLFLHWGGRQCGIDVAIEMPSDGIYGVDVVAWANRLTQHEDKFARLAIAVDPYQVGDTWYRDMRPPGFAGEAVPDPEGSLQWLAQKIIADRRFAEATVKFWWPAILGSETVDPPEDKDDAGFEGQLLAANAQHAEVARLAHGFRLGYGRRSPYNLKDLLVETVLSRWFRSEAMHASDPVRSTALHDAGARRLLTPEELSRKTAALTGFEWGRHLRTHCWPECDPTPSVLTNVDDFRLLYGGIDSDGITERARDLTSVMAGVAKRHAVEASCPIVARELYLLPDAERRLFSGIDQYVTPGRELGSSGEIVAASHRDRQTMTLSGTLAAGTKMVRLTYGNDYWEPGGDRNVRLDRLDVRDSSGRVVVRQELEHLAPLSDCNHPSGNHFALHCNGSLEVPINLPTAGQYTVEVVAWADHGGDEYPVLMIDVSDQDGGGRDSVAIRSKLVELYETLLGVRVAPHSPDVEAAYRLFVEAASRKREVGEDWFDHWACNWSSDKFFLDGIVDGAVVKKTNEQGDYYYDYDWDRVHDFLDHVDFSDPSQSAQAWVVVLAYLLMDYRYLYL